MRHARALSAILLAAYLPACTSYRMVADPATALQASPKPVKSVRITYKSGGQVILTSPWVDGDSLRGGGAGQVRAVSLADASYVEVLKPDDMKTVLLVLGSLVAAFGVVVGVAFIVLPGE